MAVSLVALLFAALVVALFSFILLFSTKKPLPRRSNGRQLPPSPRGGLPLLGHLHLLGSLHHRTLRSLATAYGPVMLLRLGSVPTVVASSAAAAEEAMKTRDLAFASRPRMHMAERIYHGRDMTFAPYGDYWRQARRICVLHLLSMRRILSFSRVREKEVAALLDRVRRAGASPPCVVNLSDLLLSYTNNVISRAAFGDRDYGIHGEDGGGTLRKVLADLSELLAVDNNPDLSQKTKYSADCVGVLISGRIPTLATVSVGEFVPWLAWVDTLTGLDAKTTRTFEALDGLLERVISDHRQRRRGGRRVGDGEVDQRDLVDVLLDLNETEDGGSDLLDMAGIKALILDMFAADTDTTYATLECAMAELINHPHEMRKLQKEVREAVGTAGHVTNGHLDKMRYLKAVIKETLRLHMPVPLLVPRETLEDTELLGYHVPARTRVLINAWAIGRDHAAWELAEEFVPERFEDAPADDMLGKDFRFVPFGAGRRGCSGVGFAVQSMELVLASLLYHFDWELPAGMPALDMSEQYGLVMRLKATLLLVAKPWSP